MQQLPFEILEKTVVNSYYEKYCKYIIAGPLKLFSIGNYIIANENGSWMQWNQATGKQNFPRM